MGYTITITESKETTKMENGTYCILNHSYLSESSYNELSYEDRKDWKKEDGQYVKTNYGYPPKVEKTTTVAVKVYEQTIEDIDIRSVINAVNQRPLNTGADPKVPFPPGHWVPVGAEK